MNSLRDKKNRHRYDVPEAQAVLSRIVPDVGEREAMARLILDVCERAADAAPNSWEVTLYPTKLLVNVGQVAVVMLNRTRVSLVSYPLKPRPRNVLEYRHREGYPVYPAVPVASAVLGLHHSQVATLAATARGAVMDFVEEAAAWKTATPWKRAHSPAVIQCLNELCSRQVPQPAYWQGGYIDSDPEGGVDTDDISPNDLAPDKEIEKAAIAFAMKHYRDLGYAVESVEAEKIGYDLRCSRGGEERHIEVKGRARDEKIVILTRREWKRARADPNWFLAIVSSVTSALISLTEWPGVGILSVFRICPIAFRITPRGK